MWPGVVALEEMKPRMRASPIWPAPITPIRGFDGFVQVEEEDEEDDEDELEVANVLSEKNLEVVAGAAGVGVVMMFGASTVVARKDGAVLTDRNIAISVCNRDFKASCKEQCGENRISKQSLSKIERLPVFR